LGAIGGVRGARGDGDDEMGELVGAAEVGRAGLHWRRRATGLAAIGLESDLATVRSTGREVDV